MQIYFAVSDFFLIFASTNRSIMALDKRKWIADQIANLGDSNYAALWNKYCEKNNYFDCILHGMDELNDMLADKTPIEILYSVSSSFNVDDSYFVVNDNYSRSYNSSSDPRYLTEEDDLVDDVTDNPSDYAEFLEEDAYEELVRKEFATEKEFNDFSDWFNEECSGCLYEYDFNELLTSWRESE